MLAAFQAIDRSFDLSPAHGAIDVAIEPSASRGLEQMERQAVTVHVRRDEEIVAQGAAAGCCYLIVSGCVRTVRLMEDGRRQVGEFLFPGDLFGWEALDEHDFAAEAVTNVVLHRYRRHDLEAFADQDKDFARGLREMAARQLRVGRERMVLLGRKTAAERVASFLLEMIDRVNQDDRAPIELPMGRADTADYLGLTIETVCRALTRFRLQGIIAVTRTRLVVRDPGALSLASCGIARRRTQHHDWAGCVPAVRPTESWDRH